MPWGTARLHACACAGSTLLCGPQAFAGSLLAGPPGLPCRLLHKCIAPGLAACQRSNLRAPSLLPLYQCWICILPPTPNPPTQLSPPPNILPPTPDFNPNPKPPPRADYDDGSSYMDSQDLSPASLPPSPRSRQRSGSPFAGRPGAAAGAAMAGAAAGGGAR